MISRKLFLRTTCIAAIAWASLQPALAQESTSYATLLTPVLKTGTDIIGQPITYPNGKATVTAAIVTLAPGVETGWHTHAVPLFVQILEGEISVDYGSKGIKIYKKGDTLMEAMNWPHNGKNTGSIPVKISAVYFGSDEDENATPTSAPK